MGDGTTLSGAGGPVDVLIVGSGSAALCAGIAAAANGASVLMIDKAGPELLGGNSRYTAGAMRFAYDDRDDLLPLLADPQDPRVADADFGGYPVSQFADDLLGFNIGAELTVEQQALVTESLPAMQWLATHGLKFAPIWGRQSFEKDGRRVFWGGLTLEAFGEGTGLVDAELDVFERLGGQVRHSTEMIDLLLDGDAVCGVAIDGPDGITTIEATSVVLACGGFESNREMRVERLGAEWAHAKVRGTPHNTGTGIALALALGAQEHGVYEHCHATPMDLHMADWGNLDIPHTERKRYRKISYFLGVMINADGRRFVDEGQNFRNYTYAQFGRSLLEQPGHFAWQLFDDKVFDLLYDDYRFEHASFVEADTLADLVAQLDGVDHAQAAATLDEYNAAVDMSTPFEPAVLDGRAAAVEPPKSNWAQRLDTPPFRAYPVTGGITFTYGGLKVDDDGGVCRPDGSVIEGLYACGELVGGVFEAGYPGGSGLTSGAVFGRRAGIGAARHLSTRP